MNRREVCFSLTLAVLGLTLYTEQALAGATPDEPAENNLPQFLECPTSYIHEVSSKAAFERYLNNLLNQGFFPITLSALGNYFYTGEKSWPEGKNPCAISFDDRLQSQYNNAVPILDKYSAQATFACMAPGWPGDGMHSYFPDEAIVEISQNWEIASHTINHVNLPNLRIRNNPAWQSEIVESKQRLEDLTGKEVSTLVYPGGYYDGPTLTLESGYYKLGTTTTPGRIVRREGLLTTPRNAVNL